MHGSEGSSVGSVVSSGGKRRALKRMRGRGQLDNGSGRKKGAAEMATTGEQKAATVMLLCILWARGWEVDAVAMGDGREETVAMAA
ncbi:hypothetical protein BHM03_00026676 [Ensete ventricosum]|nr:hypothetical protein BHM03_00026676 [Ensete ventricosum]